MTDATEPAPLRTCTTCLLAQELTAFGKNKAGKYGRQAECRTCVSARNKAWRLAHPNALREWQENNRPTARAYAKNWKSANPEKVLADKRLWRLNNLDKSRERVREWHYAHPDRASAHYESRRAQKMAAFVENVSRAVLLERDCRVCGICDLQIPTEHEDRMYRASIDHIIPLSRGGEHSYANTQPAHLICNIRKGAKIPIVA